MPNLKASVHEASHISTFMYVFHKAKKGKLNREANNTWRPRFPKHLKQQEVTSMIIVQQSKWTQPEDNMANKHLEPSTSISI